VKITVTGVFPGSPGPALQFVGVETIVGESLFVKYRLERLALIDPEKDGPCQLLKLRQIGTHEVYVKRALPWLVCWAIHSGTRDFGSALDALVGLVQNIVFIGGHYFISFVHIN
jgi:hypothetical protein